MIEVDHLTRYYGTTPALRDVSFAIDDRAVVGFLGLNGAGKSTLLQIISGLLLPSGGTVRIDGVDAVDAPDSLRSKIGFLPEDPPLYDDMTVDDFLVWCARTREMDRSTVEGRLAEVADICAIGEMRDRLIASLSHGYRKRVGIAQAIVHDPELVVLDEPISGLDPVQIVEMRDVVRRLNEHCTVLVSSHILSEISETCDRILVLQDGRLVADGTEEELAEKIGATVRLEMTVRGDRSTCTDALELIDGVGDWTAEDHRDDDLLTLDVPLERDVREELVEALVAQGVGIRSLEEAESELEQAFLGVTGESDDSDANREAAA